MTFPRPSPLPPSFAPRSAAADSVTSITKLIDKLSWGREASMSVDLHKRSGSLARRFDVAEAIQYRVIYAVCFAVFFFAAIIERAMLWKWLGARSKAERRPSILEQAREAAGTCTTYAFMG
jgi:hypothetical protein